MAGAVDLSVLKATAEGRHAPRGPTRARPAPESRPDAGQAGAPTGSAVIDVDELSFETEIVERSTRQLVVVDLWAAWAEPSRQLSPTLASLAEASGGRWVLARVDVDANPRIAQAFGAQSVPTVVALVAGRPVAMFEGAQPADQIQGWIDEIFAKAGHLLPELADEGGAPEPEQDPRMAAAEELMNSGDMDGALDAYRAIAQLEPNNVEAASVVRNLEFVTRAQAHDPDVVNDAAPGDVDAQLAAADVLLLGQRPEAAFDRLIDLIKVTRDDDRGRARARLLELFDLFDPAEPFVVAARRKLATALY
ncbi:tetratricopeptide repeat protein [Gordonia neofelifaecis]|uniref:Thioredoxin domain-containing protein n=1 Tax=Gordonia neofelifaecis NRRL B-59395 TaxID=644548 RepID=F1YPD6_9ACTN|nr:tetratricopeptide repeat protein [Gordonia neofelifaecis]EGD53456.1 Thioredoxin domain-containing protein [Gordonia neofelifaecis NRRL B-59395]